MTVSADYTRAKAMKDAGFKALSKEEQARLAMSSSYDDATVLNECLVLAAKMDAYFTKTEFAQEIDLGNSSGKTITCRFKPGSYDE